MTKKDEKPVSDIVAKLKESAHSNENMARGEVDPKAIEYIKQQYNEIEKLHITNEVTLMSQYEAFVNYLARHIKNLNLSPGVRKEVIGEFLEQMREVIEEQIEAIIEEDGRRERQKQIILDVVSLGKPYKIDKQ